MELEEVLRRRRMTRRFLPTPVDPGRLARLCDLARRVPSAGYTQGVDLLVLCEPEARRRFWSLAAEATWERGAAQAPALIAAPTLVLPLADQGAYGARYREPDKLASPSALAGLEPTSWPVPYWLVDASFVALGLLLAAEAEGLGALFFNPPADPATLLAGLGVPPDRQLIGVVALGERADDDRPSGSQLRRGRRPLDEVVHWDTW